MKQTLPRPHRWSREEFHQMGDLGWFPDQRVELIDGEIIERPVAKRPHVLSLHLSQKVLEGAFGAGHHVQNQSALNLGPDSEPEPDLAVIIGQLTDYTEHPTTALLIVEISDTTLSYDRNRKAALYAGAGIADYWIVNLVDRQLEIHRNPAADPAHPHGFRYTDVVIHGPGAVVSPLAAPAAKVAVNDLLP
jgi:Uma2 family endonuclease